LPQGQEGSNRKRNSNQKERDGQLRERKRRGNYGGLWAGATT